MQKKFQRVTGNVITTHWQNEEGDRTRYGVSFALTHGISDGSSNTPVFWLEEIEDLFSAVEAGSNWLEFVSDPEDFEAHGRDEDPA